MGNMLTHILIVLFAAKLAAEIAERLGIPTVVGEIVAGIAVWTKDNGVTGLLYGGEGVKQFVAQAIGCLVLATVMFGIALLFFKVQNALTEGGIRSAAEDEIGGFDLPRRACSHTPSSRSSCTRPSGRCRRWRRGRKCRHRPTVGRSPTGAP